MRDFMKLESKLTEEERMIRNTVREYVQEELKPNLSEWWEKGIFPEELVTEFGEMGFYAPNLDQYGLPGVSERAYGLLMQELEAGDSGLRSMASVQGALVMYPIATYGSDEQKEQYLPGLADGDLVGCFGLTEPEHGSEPSGMETSAKKEGSDYVLNGNKTWITNSPISDIAIVWARDKSDDDVVRGFIVPTELKGVTCNKIEEKFSLRASSTGTIELSNVRVPEDHILPGVRGMKGPLSCLTQARFGICWGAIGAATDAMEEALEYAKGREQWGRKIAGFQIQQQKFAEMETQITLAQLLCYRMAELKEEGKLTPQQVSMGKRNNVRMARNQTRIAREIMGGNGITGDYSPMRHLANMETVYTYEGTHDIHTLILGEEITGLRAYSG